jgi:RimJ/RimL family protein N-acetyltransferase
MSLIGLKGERVRLVPPDRTLHLENALRWMNDPDVIATIEMNLGVARGQEEEYFRRIETERETQLVWAILDEKERHVGFIDLRGISWRHRSATGGILIGERSAWGKGYATDAVRVRTRFAFETLGLHRVEGHTMNPAMERVYEKAGYRREGTARQKVWRGGRWLDVGLFAILESDWASLSSNGPT